MYKKRQRINRIPAYKEVFSRVSEDKKHLAHDDVFLRNSIQNRDVIAILS